MCHVLLCAECVTSCCLLNVSPLYIRRSNPKGLRYRRKSSCCGFGIERRNFWCIMLPVKIPTDGSLVPKKRMCQRSYISIENTPICVAYTSLMRRLFAYYLRIICVLFAYYLLII